MIQLASEASNHEAEDGTLNFLTRRYKFIFSLSEASLRDQQTILEKCVQLVAHIGILVLVEVLRSQMLSDVREVAHLEDLIKGYHILQFHLIEWSTFILEGCFNLSLNFAAEHL